MKSGDDCNCGESFVEDFVGMQVLFVNCTNKSCFYYMPYGNSTICNSENRKKIYKTLKR
jgi:hypothetical protein